MNFRPFIFLLMLFCTSSLHAQSYWESISSGLEESHGAYQDLFIDNKKRVIVTTNEGFFRSENGRGFDFVKMPISGTSQQMIHTRKSHILLAVSRGNIWRSQDDGKSWINIIQPAIYRIENPKDDVLFAMIREKVLYSLDLGNTWHETNLPNETYNTQIYFINNRYVAFAKIEDVLDMYESSDGKSWTKQENYPFAKKEMTYNAFGYMICTSKDGHYAISKDWGQTWKVYEETPNAFNWLSSVRIDEKGNLFAMGEDDVVRYLTRSEDDGQTWETVLTTVNYLSQITFSVSLMMISTPVKENVFQYYFSWDQGKTWQQNATLLSGYNARFIRFGTQKLFFIGNGSKIYESSDNGKSWSVVSLPVPRYTPIRPDRVFENPKGVIRSEDKWREERWEFDANTKSWKPFVRDYLPTGTREVVWANEQEIWAIVKGDNFEDGQMIYYSSNGGKSWLEVNINQQKPYFLEGLLIAPNGNVYILNSRHKWLMSADKGNSWQAFSLKLEAEREEIQLDVKPYFTTKGTILWESNAGELIRSTNSGKDWQKTGLTLYATNVSCQYQNTIYTFGKQNDEEGYALFSSTDDGKSWQESKINIPYSRVEQCVFTENGTWYILSGRLVFQSRDLGKTWQNLNIDLRSETHDMLLANDGHLYLTTYQGVFRSAFKADAPLPTVSGLEAPYPNPTEDTANLVYHLPEASQVRIEVFNVLGQKIETLVNGFYGQGSFFATWNAQFVAKGVYFVRFTTATFSQTQKVVVN